MTSDVAPVGETPCCGARYEPVVSMHRVTGAIYKPYMADAGSPEWVKAANVLLEDIANYNFRK